MIVASNVSGKTAWNLRNAKCTKFSECGDGVEIKCEQYIVDEEPDQNGNSKKTLFIRDGENCYASSGGAAVNAFLDIVELAEGEIITIKVCKATSKGGRTYTKIEWI